MEIRASLCDWHVYTQGIHIYVIALSVREIPSFSCLRGVSWSVCCSGALTGNSSPVNMVVHSALRGPVAIGVFFVGERKEMHVRRVTDLFVRSRIGRDKRPIY